MMVSYIVAYMCFVRLIDGEKTKKTGNWAQLWPWRAISWRRPAEVQPVPGAAAAGGAAGAAAAGGGAVGAADAIQAGRGGWVPCAADAIPAAAGVGWLVVLT